MFKQTQDTPGTTGAEPGDPVQQARRRARQRLIGAIVLLGIGIIGFPLVFETQPRPIPVDIPIEIPKKDGAPPLAMPSLRPAAPVAASSGPSAARAGAAEMITESREEAGRDVSPAAGDKAVAKGEPAAKAVAAKAGERPADKAAAKAIAEATDKAGDKPADKPATRMAEARPEKTAARPVERAVAGGDGERARALLEGRSAAADPTPRFVVQVGAFAEAGAAREARQRAERLGLKTYTQVAQTPSGSRIRVRLGPFASRDEAEAALAKAKAAGLTAVVLTL